MSDYYLLTFCGTFVRPSVCQSNQIKSSLLNNKGLKATYRLLKQSAVPRRLNVTSYFPPFVLFYFLHTEYTDEIITGSPWLVSLIGYIRNSWLFTAAWQTCDLWPVITVTVESAAQVVMHSQAQPLICICHILARLPSTVDYVRTCVIDCVYTALYTT